MSASLVELLIRISVLAIFLGGLAFVMKAMLRRSHSGMDNAIQLQQDSIKAQADGMQIAREGLDLQKQTLAEMQEIRKLLEKR